MLQNRVDPFGNLIKTKARGLWMGNRGQLHNARQQIQRPFKLKAWLICKLEFKERKRRVMSPNLYTELFFMDEATAFAAGHRPCCECRREDFNKFKSFWLKGNPGYGFTEKTYIRQIDDVIHQERISKGNSKVTYKAQLSQLPDGSFVQFNGDAYLIFNNQMYLWSPFGYEKGRDFPEEAKMYVLTPRSLVNTFKAGYEPQIAVNN